MTAPSVRERGEYRAIYTRLVAGPDYRALTPDAKLVLFTLKLTLPHWGIGVLDAAAHVMAARTGLPEDRCHHALWELREQGWIDFDDAVCWIIRGLEFEPSMTPDNLNHRKACRSHLEGLPRSAVVARFAERYASYLASDVPSSPVLAGGTAALPMPRAEGHADGLGDGMPIPSRSNSSSSNKNKSSSTATATREADGVAGEVAPVELTPAQRLVIAANRALDERYGPATHPLLPGQPGTVETLRQLEQAGVPLAYAEAVIAQLARECRLASRPRSLKYFAAATVERWSVDGVRDAAPLSTTPPTPTTRRRRSRFAEAAEALERQDAATQQEPPCAA